MGFPVHAERQGARDGFDSLKKVSLAAARKKAIDARPMLSEGQDPLAHRREKEERRTAAERLAAASSMTSDDCAEAYICAHEAGAGETRNTANNGGTRWRLTSHRIRPDTGSTRDVALIMKVLEPIWNRKTETASRIRGRIEVILDWARVRGYRTCENPARHGAGSRESGKHRGARASFLWRLT